MKKLTFVLLIMICYTPVLTMGQDKKDFDAVIGRFQQFYNDRQMDSVYSLLSDRSKAMMPPDKMKAAMEQLYSQAGKLNSYQFSHKEDKISYYAADFAAIKLDLLASLNAENKLDAFSFIPHKAEDVATHEQSNIVLNTPTGKIYGSVTEPEHTKKVPVVLIIAGSGPTDRDGNNDKGLTTNAYKMIADSLKKAGIACVRYDKRGVGESKNSLVSESSIDFNVYVNDAAGILEMLKKDNRFSEVIVAGHSEGSLIGMLAAQKVNVKKYISIAGAGERIDKTLEDQLRVQSEELAATATKILDSLKQGLEVTDIPGSLYSLFRPSIQPYMRSWLQYDPQEEIKKLKIPILILQGKNDLQVSVVNAENLKKAAPRAKLILFDKMNHILKDASEDRQENFATYSNGDLPLTTGFAAAIIKFVKE